MQVCNLLGNIYNKAYRSILGIIMMSNDGRICLMSSDKNIMVCCSKYNLSDFMAAILNFMFSKKPTKKKVPHPPRYHHRGTSQSIIKTEKNLSDKTMLVAVSLQYPVVFAYICINIDFTIFKNKNK